MGDTEIHRESIDHQEEEVRCSSMGTSDRLESPHDMAFR